MRTRRRVLPTRVGYGPSASRRRLIHAYESPAPTFSTSELLAGLSHIVRIDTVAEVQFSQPAEPRRPHIQIGAASGSKILGR